MDKADITNSSKEISAFQLLATHRFAWSRELLMALLGLQYYSSYLLDMRHICITLCLFGLSFFSGAIINTVAYLICCINPLHEYACLLPLSHFRCSNILTGYITCIGNWIYKYVKREAQTLSKPNYNMQYF